MQNFLSESNDIRREGLEKAKKGNDVLRKKIKLQLNRTWERNFIIQDLYDKGKTDIIHCHDIDFQLMKSFCSLIPGSMGPYGSVINSKIGYVHISSCWTTLTSLYSIAFMVFVWSTN
ncbi:hypothetical protein NC652_001166 [Populus alba x Populus x berolinensis]|nr:hypothetical protein NC652_001166 [Populus alba x Populus x berolinensis]